MFQEISYLTMGHIGESEGESISAFKKDVEYGR